MCFYVAVFGAGLACVDDKHFYRSRKQNGLTNNNNNNNKAMLRTLFVFVFQRLSTKLSTRSSSAKH